MAKLVDYNYDTDFAAFAVHDADEIAVLPTTTAIGSGGLVSKPIKAGVAYTTDGNFDIYTLDDYSDAWIKKGAE